MKKLQMLFAGLIALFVTGCGNGSTETSPLAGFVEVVISENGLPELVNSDAIRSNRLTTQVVRGGTVNVADMDQFFIDYITAYEGGGLFTEGTYTGIAPGGAGGRVQVNITYSEDAMLSVVRVDPLPEDRQSDHFENAWDILSQQLIELQTTQLDTISGATLSSHFIIYAFNDSIRHALRELVIVEYEDPSVMGTGRFIPGVYTASAIGRNDYVTVTASFDATTLYKVEIQHRETPEHAHEQIESLARDIINRQGDIDIYTGATRSSVAIIASLDVILGMARE